MEHIVGHADIMRFFSQVIDNGNIHHAYCFVGPEHVGRRAVAETVAARLLDCPRERLATAPDFFLLEKEVNEKTGERRQDITIDQVRAVRMFLSQRAFGGGYKVVVIVQAEKLNESAANAFLKALEEPGKKTVLFLITEDEDSLPPTVLSRCQIVYFSTVSQTDILPLLKEIPGISQEALLRLAAGRPGYIRLWADAAERQMIENEVTRWNALQGASFGEKLGLVEDLFGETDGDESARDRVKKVLPFWQLLARDLALNHSIRISSYVNIMDRIRSADKHLEENVNPRLALEQVLLHIDM